MKPSRRVVVLILVILVGAALLSAAFRFGSIRSLVYAVTGEDTLAGQARGVFQWAFRWTRPLPQTVDDVPVAYTDLAPFGINTFINLEVEPEKRARSLEMIAAAGFQWIRQEFPWEDIEIHAKGDFEDRRNEPYRSAWEKYDNIVALAEHYDLQIIARLSNPPAWSRSRGDENGTYAPPDDFEDYADFAAAVASRYQGRIRFYQVWNEPNIYPEWGNQPVDPEAYTRLLCLAYQRIKATDPDAVVIGGALAPTDQLGTLLPDGSNNLMDVIFLQRMYDAGAGDCFDVMAVNDYMLFSGPTDRRMRPNLINFSRPQWVRDVMVANGDAHKPVWLTEMNSNVVPEGLPTIFGRVTEEQQARYAVEALERIQREWPWVGMVNVWFFKRPWDLEKDQAWYYFRLVEPDFTPLPIYTSLKTYLTSLEPVLYRGYHSATTWQIRYQGDWEVSDAGMRTGSPDAALALTWEGRQLTLIPGDARATVRVSTNNGQPEDIRLCGQPVTLARRLWSRQTTLDLTIIEGAATLEGFQIR
ncbi:MAG: cellulase family glycosylhydrolase [Anaerolineae bacterium]|nr:cellulase family glycosylhydrolase [Anaerolineae bacterium]